MTKKISYIFYKFIKLFDSLLLFLTNKSLLMWFKDFFHEDSYKKIKILEKEVSFFIPNSLTEWRADTFRVKEPETLEWIDSFKNEKNITFWDIGANIGLYSIYNVLKNNKSTSISFEPSTSNLRILSRNISINELDQKIKIMPIALTNLNNAFLSMNEGNFIEGGALNAFGENINFEGKEFLPKMKYTTYGTSINSLIEQNILEIPNYVKIDVDGIEHLILQGASKILESKKLISLSIEINEDFLKQYENITKIMKNYNFRVLHKRNNLQITKNSVFENTFNYIFER